jgi:hypothetical protein
VYFSPPQNTPNNPQKLARARAYTVTGRDTTPIIDCMLPGAHRIIYFRDLILTFVIPRNNHSLSKVSNVVKRAAGGSDHF